MIKNWKVDTWFEMINFVHDNFVFGLKLNLKLKLIIEVQEKNFGIQKSWWKVQKWTNQMGIEVIWIEFQSDDDDLWGGTFFLYETKKIYMHVIYSQ